MTIFKIQMESRSKLKGSKLYQFYIDLWRFKTQFKTIKKNKPNNVKKEGKVEEPNKEELVTLFKK